MSEVNEVAEIQASAEITSIAEEEHIIEGYASTYKPMRNGYLLPKDTLVKALAGYMQNPVLLLNHDINRPIGRVIDARVDEQGLWIKAKIEDEEIWQKIKAGLFKGLSVGGQGRIVPVDETGLKHVIDFDMWEISVVAVPADAGAVIEVISYVAPVVNTPYSLDESWDWDWADDANAILERYGWEGLARACAYVEMDGNKLPQRKEAYHLPHHKLINGQLTLVYGGVVAALRRLPRTNISDNAKAEARRHLEAHLEFLKSKMEKSDAEQSASDIIKVIDSTEVRDMSEITSRIERVEQTVEELKTEYTKILNSLKRQQEMSRDTEIAEAVKDPMVVTDALRLAFAKDLHMEREIKPVYPVAEKLSFAYLEGTDAAGGIMVLPEYDKKLYTHIVEHSPLLSQFQTQTHKSPKYIRFVAKDSAGNIVQKPTATRIDINTIETTGIPEVAYMTFSSEEGVIRAFAGYFQVSLFLIKDLPATYDFIQTALDMLAVGVRNTLDQEIVTALTALGAADGIVYYEDTALPTLDTMRLWVAQQIANGWSDLVWVMSPNTENYYFTLKDNNNQYYFGGPIDTVAHRIWNVPVVVDNNMPDTDILLISRTSSVKLHRMEGIQIEVNQQAQDLWRKYLAEYRYVTRWDYEILFKPSILRFHIVPAT